MHAGPDIIDLGRLPYAAAYAEQTRRAEQLHAARENPALRGGAPAAGTILLVEHDPVITISRRQGARANLLATPELLARHGVAIEETDRGGDITYHGPGQLVVYPILDLSLINLGLHGYMRLLEDAVIATCAAFGLAAGREEGATGVWIGGGDAGSGQARKIAAMGVRVRRWVSMHGLALNVTTNLEHFGLIVPCGLVGRPVTSLAKELGEACPSMDAVKRSLVDSLVLRVMAAEADAERRRAEPASG